MPIYQFYNKNTDEVEEHIMSHGRLDEFKKDNPHLERYFCPESLPGFGDGIRMNVAGVGKPDSTFEKYVINRIKEAVPGNTLAKSHKTKTPREW
jgi:hypothetical protein